MLFQVSLKLPMILLGTAFLCNSYAEAQVVRLPTIGVQSYSGSVLVPDRGSAWLGGYNTQQAYASQSGVPRTRNLSTRSTAGNSSVHAHIIDLDEIDRIIRGDVDPNAIQANSRIPSMSTRKTTGRNTPPVAGIYASPTPEEKASKSKAGRSRRLSDFTPGDYMMLLSHPGLVEQANTENDQAVAKRRSELNVPITNQKAKAIKK